MYVHTNHDEKAIKIQKEPIAIVGIGCRFPGGASNPTKFWELLCSGKDAIIEVPKNRWDIRRFYDENSDRPGKMYVKEGGFLQENIFEFDPMFFGISPREAATLDPQQRLLLEVTWEAMEDAGIVMVDVSGSKTGVFIGGFFLDNMVLRLSDSNKEIINSHTATSLSSTLLSNRISYTFNLMGPSISVDTACSSSLSATHIACQSIWNKDCTMAILGGVSVMLWPEASIALCKGKFLSKHARCMTFDERAGGYSRGEGCGIVILKPLSEALKDNDRIYALIKETGVNQDGKTNGITLPNSQAQKSLIQEVYNKAQITSSNVGYIEAHGTGTQAGDFAEATALNEIMSIYDRNEKCFVGSVKTVIGHTEAAAGIAGLIKSALCLNNQAIPPHMNFQKANPKIPFEDMKIRLPLGIEKWERGDKPRYAGVNSFGYGGANAHVLLEEAPIIKSRESQEQKGQFIVPISAQNENALKQIAERYHDFLCSESNVNLNDFLYTVTKRRTHHNYRTALIATSQLDLCSGLKAVAKGEMNENIFSSKVITEEKPKLIFVYTGMGPQWWAMGRELMETEPVYAEMMIRCDSIFKKYSGWSLIEELSKDEDQSSMGKTFVAQPTNFALQVSLTKLLESMDVIPDAVVGHSVGEVAAAYVSGSLTLEDAVLLSYHRSRLQQTLAGKGKMMAVGLSEVDAEKLIKKYEGVSIAAINDMSSVTLAGEQKSLEAIQIELEKEGIYNAMLHVEVAFHSQQMDAIKEEFLMSLRNINPQKADIPFYSTVTGIFSESALLDAEYWWQNVRKPVLFAKALDSVIDDNYNILLEIGPHPVLRNSIIKRIKERSHNGIEIPTLIRKKPEARSLVESLARLYLAGYSVNWDKITPKGGRLITLPNYAWQKEYYWEESEISRQERFGQSGHVYLNNDLRQNSPTFEVELNNQFFPYLKDHCIGDTIVFPGAGYIEAGFALNQKIFNKDECTLKNIQFHQMLAIEADRIQRLHLNYDASKKTYSVFSRFVEDDVSWMLHSTGKIMQFIPDEDITSKNLNDIVRKCKEEINIEDFYNKLSSSGLLYGSFFRTAERVWKGTENEVLVKIKINTLLEKSNDGYLIHPTILDATFQGLVALFDIGMEKEGTPYIPVELERITLYKSVGDKCWAYGKIMEKSDKRIKGDILIFNDEGEVVVDIKGIHCQAIAGIKEQSKENSTKEKIYEYSWENSERTDEEIDGKRLQNCLVFLDNSNWGQDFIEMLKRNNIGYTEVEDGECFRRTDNNKYTVRKDRSDDILQLFSELKGQAFTDVIYLWTLNEKQSLLDINVSNLVDHCLILASIVKGLKDNSYETSVSIISRGSEYVNSEDSISNLIGAGIAGLGELITNEYPNIQCKVFDLSYVESQDEQKLVLDELLSGNTERDVAFRNGRRFVKRLMKISTDNKDVETMSVSTKSPVCLVQDIRGNLNSLHYIVSNRNEPTANEIEIQNYASALNFKDVLKVHGRISPKAIKDTYIGENIGMECSGKVIRIGENIKEFKVGDEVGVFASNTFQSYITCNPETSIIYKRPKGFSYEDTPLFVPFFTAYYALIKIANLQKGEKVLIHNAAGGVGLSAIQIAQWKGAEIFATVGNETKRDYLKSMGIEHILNSRSLEFTEYISKATNNKGVDVVLNAMTGDALVESFELLAPYGRFIEIGKRDITENSDLPMRTFNNNVIFASFDLDRMLKDKLYLVKEIWKEILSGFEEGYFVPLPTTVFEASEALEAFDFMHKSNHIGRILLNFKESSVNVPLKTKEGYDFKKSGTFLITGGTKGFGLEIAKWLASKGVEQLVLISRSGVNSIEGANTIADIEKNGTKVVVKSVDICNKNQVQELLKYIKSNLPPLRGIFHGAMVLNDGYLIDLDRTSFNDVINPKVLGAINLHNYTKDESLDFFISLSSISSIIGNPKQGNYVVANTFLDSFAHYRRSRNLPATTINLGVLGDTGVVARSEKLNKYLEMSGVKALKNEEIFNVLEYILENKFTQVGLFDIDWVKWGKARGSKIASSRFKRLIEESKKQNNETGMVSEFIEKIHMLKEEEIKEKLIFILRNIVAKLLRCPVDGLDINKGLVQLGVDSLMSVELQGMIAAELGVEVAAVDILKGPSIIQLANILLIRVKSMQLKKDESGS